jgi:hypothetical protein
MLWILVTAVGLVVELLAIVVLGRLAVRQFEAASPGTGVMLDAGGNAGDEAQLSATARR